jgi:hypothetical protein
MSGVPCAPDHVAMTNSPAFSRVFVVPEPRRLPPDASPAAAESIPGVRRYRLARLRINEQRPDGSPGFAHLKRCYD